MKTITAISIILLTGMIACKKESTPSSPVGSDHKNMIKTRTEIDVPFTAQLYSNTYYYSENNMIDSIKSADGTGYINTYRFTFKPGLIMRQRFDQDGIPRDIDSLYLNSKGLLEVDHLLEGQLLLYTYDANGYVVEEINRTSNDTLEIDRNTIKNGNYLVIEESYPNTGGYEHREYYFNTQESNTITWDRTGEPFYGKVNTNLIDHVSFISCAGIYRVDTYSYEFNDDGLITHTKCTSTATFKGFDIYYTYY